ncbi:hypothetical protein BC830DRAFT_1124834 [Chytriomyces sp. MP71]|nr:hypothetical protein BC830DRAFT_1124834 [Chytriomyces sp. MP71]
MRHDLDPITNSCAVLKSKRDPNVKNTLQKHNGSQGAKAATVEKKVKGAQSSVQKKLLELAKVKDKAIDHELDTICSFF